MGKCHGCGKEVGGALDLEPFPICPDCQKKELEREHLDLERENMRRQEAIHAEEREAAREAEYARQQRHEEEMQALRDAEEAQQQRFETLQEQQRQDREFEDAKMRCRWCGKAYTFRNGEGLGIYCSKKCAVDELGQEEFPAYLEKTDALLLEITAQNIKEKKYLNAVISAEGCKDLPADLKGQVGNLYLDSTNRNIQSARGKKLLEEAVLAGSAESAKLFLRRYPLAGLSCSAYAERVKFLLPSFAAVEKEFDCASDTPEKIDVLENILHQWQGYAVDCNEISQFIRQKRTFFLQQEYDAVLKQKEKAETADEYYKTAELFDALAEKYFKDAAEQAADCRRAALQKKIESVAQKKQKAQTFEDFLDVVLLYLELQELNVENVSAHFQDLSSRAAASLANCNSPERHKQCMQKIRMINSKGFPDAELLRKSYSDRIEVLWRQALQKAGNAKTEDEYKDAIDALKKFEKLKKDRATAVINELTLKTDQANERFFKIFMGVFFVQWPLFVICGCMFLDMKRLIYWILSAVLALTAAFLEVSAARMIIDKLRSGKRN